MSFFGNSTIESIARLTGAAKNTSSSDSSGVLDAGWQAMQSADPELASAISKLPPQVAQGAVLQYTNAIRMGKEADASVMASEAVREGFASMPQQAPQASRLVGAMGAAMSRAMGIRQPQYEIGDFDSFSKASTKAPAPAYGGFLSKALGSRLLKQQQQQQQSPQNMQALYKGVNDKYSAYEMSGYTDDEKNVNSSYGLGLDPSKKKALTSTNWSMPQQGLIGSNMGNLNFPSGN